MPPERKSFYIALFVAFIDLMGIGLIFPLFSSMLFSESFTLLHPDTSAHVRGIYLGLLIALMPLTQFFSAPIWGTLSDGYGRKKPLQYSLTTALIGYLVALLGVSFKNIFILLASRIVVGFAAGNTSIVQATIADLSSVQSKAKNFGLYSMALGMGFTIGPFFGGYFAKWGYAIPFLFAACMVSINLAFVFLFFRETHLKPIPQKISWGIGFSNLKKAFAFHEVRTILLASFLHNFGWSYFFEFVPVYFIDRFQFTPKELGYFYASVGAFYALSTGLLIRPLIKRFKPELLFFAGNLLGALTIFSLSFVKIPVWIWPLQFLLCYFIAFVAPTYTTLISNNAPKEIQGEALGVLSSVNAAALIFSPLFSGSLVGIHPSLSMWIGGSIMLVGSAILLRYFFLNKTAL